MTEQAKLKSAREQAVAAEPLGDPPLYSVRRYLICDALHSGGLQTFTYCES